MFAHLANETNIFTFLHTLKTHCTNWKPSLLCSDSVSYSFCFAGEVISDPPPGVDLYINRELEGQEMSWGIQNSADACHQECTLHHESCAGTSYDPNTMECKLYKCLNSTTVLAGIDSTVRRSVLLFHFLFKQKNNLSVRGSRLS